jgi:hypothetical protein
MRRLLNHRAAGIFCSLLLIILLSACNLVPAETTPVATPDLPRVEFLSPPNRATVVEGALMDIDIVAQDETAGIRSVELFVDGNLLQTGETESGNEEIYRVTMNWLAEGIGNHSLSAIAYRSSGVASRETTIVVEVVSDGSSTQPNSQTRAQTPSNTTEEAEEAD